MRKDYLSCRKIGLKIDLNSGKNDYKSWKEHAQFQKYLFEYFQELNSRQTGWGVSFNDWVGAVKGWKHLGMDKYEKEHGIRE